MFAVVFDALDFDATEQISMDEMVSSLGSECHGPRGICISKSLLAYDCDVDAFYMTDDHFLVLRAWVLRHVGRRQCAERRRDGERHAPGVPRGSLVFTFPFRFLCFC